MYTLKKYDVIRLIEHDGRCHVSMDRMQGLLLADWMKEAQAKRMELDKETFYVWLKHLARQLEQYHRSGRGAGYRYLNPYSILIGESGELCLLDLTAEENEFVLKSLQERGMREQFVRPLQKICDKMPSRNKEVVDIYCYGKTIQLLFVRVREWLDFSKAEERCLERFIRRCVETEEPRAYKSLGQMKKEVPKQQHRIELPYKRQMVIAMGILVIAFATERMLSIVQAGQVMQEEVIQEEVMQDQVIQEKVIQEEDSWEDRTDQAIEEIYKRLEALEGEQW